MKKIVFLLFLFCTGLFAKEIHSTEQIISLTDNQKKILYEFAVLQKGGSDANAYWLQHKNQFGAINDSLRNQLANEIYANSHIVYIPVKDSAVQLWMQTQSLTNWMLYLAAFIAICAIIGLLRNYWNSLIGVLIKQFAPLFKVLFSEILLTYELLLIGLACIVGGTYLEDMVIRTVVIHIGFFLLWSQSTAIFTKKYLVRSYLHKIGSNFREMNSWWEVLKTISLPAAIVTLAILYILNKVPGDVLYNYEIVITSLLTVYFLPIWRPIKKYICPILIPYKDAYIEDNIYLLATCTVFALFIDALFLWVSNSSLLYVISVLTSLLILSFLILSLKMNYKYNYKNYFYLQFVTVLFLISVVLYSFYIQSGEMIWISLIGVCIFIIIKYWEILDFNFSWGRRSVMWTWGFLGMAVLLWLLAKGILYVSGKLYVV